MSKLKKASITNHEAMMRELRAAGREFNPTAAYLIHSLLDDVDSNKRVLKIRPILKVLRTRLIL